MSRARRHRRRVMLLLMRRCGRGRCWIPSTPRRVGMLMLLVAIISFKSRITRHQDYWQFRSANLSVSLDNRKDRLLHRIIGDRPSLLPSSWILIFLRPYYSNNMNTAMPRVCSGFCVRCPVDSIRGADFGGRFVDRGTTQRGKYLFRTAA